VLFHYGNVLEIRDARERATRAFQRARILDPNFALPLPYLVQLAALENNRKMLDSLAPEVIADSSDDGDFARWRLALARGDNAMLRRIRARFSRMPLQSLRAIAMAAQYDSAGKSDAYSAATMLARRVLGPEERFDALLGLHSAAMLTNRPAIVRQTLQDMRQVRSGARQARRLMVTDALYGGGDSTGIAAVVVTLRSDTSITDRETALDHCVAAQWEVIRGAGAPLEDIRQTITKLRDTAIVNSDDAALLACSALLEVLTTVGSAQKYGEAAFALLDSLVSTGAPVGELQSYLPLVTSRIAEVFGDSHRAQALRRMWPYMRGWPVYQLRE
jgi:hypothetical protein